MLVVMCDSWAAYLSELSKGRGPHIADLSRELPPEKAFAVYQWVSEFVYNCALLEWNLNVTGVMEAAEPWLERMQIGESVPPDIERAVGDLQETWLRLFAEVEPAAYNWIDSQFKRPEVIEFSEREKARSHDRLDEQRGVFHLDQYRQLRKDRTSGVWGNRVGRAG